MVAKFLFGLSLILFFHTWIGYLFILFILQKLANFRRKNSQPVQSQKYFPTVSVIIPAYNAVDKIIAKLRNALMLDYPADKIEIIVVSDGSTDDTVQKAKSLKAVNVFTYELIRNQGKSAAQNYGAISANNEILIFTDVDSILDKNFIRNIILYFDDPNVACVGGNAMLRTQNGHISGSHGFYWKIEQFIRKAESNLGMLHSLPGWGFAIRKSDFVPLDPDTGDDMILPLEMALRKKRSVIAPDAIVSDYMPSSIKGELKARQRITLRNLTGIVRRKTLLNPFVFPRLSFAIWSHKLLRWCSPLLLVIMFGCNLWLYIFANNKLYEYLLLSQTIFYLIGILSIKGLFKNFKIPLAGFISSFLLANVGFLLGLVGFIKGQRIKSYKN